MTANLNFLSPVYAALKKELRDDPSRPNFYGQAIAAKAAITEAMEAENHQAQMSAAAAYGGVVKRWRRWLIENLTSAALDGVETSREGVRIWQQQVFGKAVASSRLTKYGKPEHSGGGRVGQIEVPQPIQDEVIAFYKANLDKIKSV